MATARRTAIQIAVAVIRLEDLCQQLKHNPESLGTMCFAPEQSAAMLRFLEEIKLGVALLHHEWDITDIQFYKEMVTALPYLHHAYKQEEDYLELLAPLVDLLFLDFEPKFCEKLKQLFTPALSYVRKRHLM